MYYAHKSEDGKLQTVIDHLNNVAKLSGDFAKDFNAENTAYICGILHDIGKCSKEFENRLLNDGPKVDHSTAGAKVVKELYDDAFQRILGYIICGHHSGLMDFGSYERGLQARLNKDIPKYEMIIKNIKVDSKLLKNELLNKLENNKFKGFSIGFYIRMVYSCLVDADFLDTEEFFDISKSEIRKKIIKINDLYNSFTNFMERKNKESKLTEVNKYRQQIYKDCINAGNEGINLFSLTVPTGGGKTLSSMAFALEHLKKNNLNRIICVIPYTSIIEQNAKQYKEIFGKENVLEHHSNFNFDKEEFDEDYNTTKLKIKYASENWDVPIIVTTNVQFFESLFSNKSSRCRKIHNISNSVIIIDEAQMLPIKYLKVTMQAIKQLVYKYNTSVVLSTATKPEFPKEALEEKPKEIIKNPQELYNGLKRVKIKYLGDLDDELLSEKINALDQVLVIVNTRKHAQKLYDMCDKEKLFHLSANMCPVNRSEVLDEIRKNLKNNIPCKIISTQLIECGVDISLPVVFRALSGIDSIAQAAGRCNREGELDVGQVYVFNSTEDYGKAIMYQSVTAECGRQILEEYKDPLSLEAISDYFNRLYSVEKDLLDTKKIMDDFEERVSDLAFSFEKAAHDYKLIDETESLIIPYNNEAEKLIEEIKYIENTNKIARKLQKYTISIHKNKLDELTSLGIIININNQFTVLGCLEGFYDKKLGLYIDKDETLII